MSQEQNRLNRDSSKEIAKEFKKVGLKVTFKSIFKSTFKDTTDPPKVPTTIYIWDKGTKECVATMKWVSGHGWQVFAALPYVLTNQDLDLAADEVATINQGSNKAMAAFDAFRKSRTPKNWATYTGILAALYCRPLQTGAP